MQLMIPALPIQFGIQLFPAVQEMVQVQVQELVDVVVENLGLDQIQMTVDLCRKHLDVMELSHHHILTAVKVKLVDPDQDDNQEHQETLEPTELEMPVVLQPQPTLVVEEEQERLATPMEQDTVVMQKQLPQIFGVITHINHPQERWVPVAVDKTNPQVSVEVAVLLILVVVEMLEEEMQVVMEMVEAVLAFSQQPVEAGQMVPCGSK
jgi:hypothetical protein